MNIFYANINIVRWDFPSSFSSFSVFVYSSSLSTCVRTPIFSALGHLLQASTPVPLFLLAFSLSRTYIHVCCRVVFCVRSSSPNHLIGANLRDLFTVSRKDSEFSFISHSIRCLTSYTPMLIEQNTIRCIFVLFSSELRKVRHYFSVFTSKNYLLRETNTIFRSGVKNCIGTPMRQSQKLGLFEFSLAAPY